MASNIQYYMEKRGMNAKGFATELDFKYTTVLDWLNTKTYPRIDKIEIMANFFGIEKSDLVEEKTKPNPKGIKIPVLGIVPAGVPIEAVEDILDYEEIPQSWANQGEFFGLRISGDSMLPDITDNDIVIVRQQSMADNGDTVIALINGDVATCKRFQRQTNGIMLIPNNSSYPTYFYSNEEIENLPVKIVGKVVELRRKY